MAVVTRLVFVLLLVVSPIVVFGTSSPLPARVATHFGRGGLANGWMTHDGYIVFMLLMMTVLPLVVTLVTGLLPAAARSLVRKRASSIDAARFEDMVRWLGGHAALLGSLLCLLFLAVHFLLLDANARTPARLDEPTFLAVLGGFVALIVVWIAVMALRLRRR